MKKISLFLLLIVAFSFAPHAATAQKKNSDALPKNPIDTLDTDNPKAKIIIYTNNTWRYYYPDYAALASKPVFMNHWDTQNVFAYRDVHLADIPESMEIELIQNTGDFHIPIGGRILSSYGPRGRRAHKGVDLLLHSYDPVYAAFEGKVRYAAWNSGGYGNLVIIRHPNGLETYYGHLAQMNVLPDDYVIAGQVIGYGGSTGRSRGPHLHFEVRYADLTIDPERIIDFSSGSLRYQTFILERAYFNVSSKKTETLDEDDMTEQIFTNEDGTPVTSEDIIKNIEEVQQETAESAKQETQPDKGNLYHTVRKGDTLYSIARKNNTTVKALCKLNGISESSKLRPGQKIKVR